MRKNDCRPGGRFSTDWLFVDASTSLLAVAAAILFLADPLLFGADPPLVGAPVVEDGSSTNEESAKKEQESDKSGGSRLSPEAVTVKKHLKDYLNPSELKFLKGGRVRLKFDFAEKSEHHEKIFLPPIGSGIKAPFRWSQEGEDAFVGSERGIRISDEGFAMLDCWFLDDFEAHIEVLQHINYSPRMYVAVTFNNEKGRGLGSNYGAQCALFSRGKLSKRGRGKTTGIPFNVKAKLTLFAKDGVAEARKGTGSRAKDRMKFSRKSYPSGRIGFAWGGSMSATITSLEVTGKLDIPAMAKLLEKKPDPGD